MNNKKYLFLIFIQISSNIINKCRLRKIALQYSKSVCIGILKLFYICSSFIKHIFKEGGVIDLLFAASKTFFLVYILFWQWILSHLQFSSIKWSRLYVWTKGELILLQLMPLIILHFWLALKTILHDHVVSI